MAQISNSLSVAGILDDLSKHVDQAVYKGDFWLSVNRPSSYWIYLKQLDEKNMEFKKPLEKVFHVFLKNFLEEKKGGWYVVFCDQERAERTELDLHRNIIDLVEDLISVEASLKRRLDHLIVGLNANKEVVEIPNDKDLSGKNCLIIVGLSLHIDLIKHLQRGLIKRGAHAEHVLAVIEREGNSRSDLKGLGLELIPAMVWHQGQDDLKVTSILKHHEEPYKTFHKYFQEDSENIDLDVILTQHPAKKSSKLAGKLQDLQSKIDQSLYQKAERIIRGIDSLYDLHGEIQLIDTETIQKWVLQELSPEDFKTMAKVSFEAWATPDRLKGEGVPHIKVANDKMGEQIAQIISEMGIKTAKLLDLGAGTLGTVSHIVTQCSRSGAHLVIDAVEFTPALLKIAHERQKELEKANDSLITIHESEMLDFVRRASNDSYHFVTISYAIHHLHPDDQLDLMRQVQRCLRPGGAFLIADPQEGKSDFNRSTLLREEPEAVFAIFSSPEQSLRNLENVGFTQGEILEKDDAYKGFAICARKPQ